MEVHITPETEAKLEDLARRTHKGKTQLLGEAVEQLLQYNDWFEHKVGDSRAAVERGGVVPDDEVAAWLERQERRLQSGR